MYYGRDLKTLKTSLFEFSVTAAAQSKQTAVAAFVVKGLLAYGPRSFRGLYGLYGT
jgi:hypothetical protein